MSKSENNGSDFFLTSTDGESGQGAWSWVVWIPGLVVLLIIVMAVAFAMETVGLARNPKSHKQMTPIVGGMAFSSATGAPELANDTIEPRQDKPFQPADPSRFVPGQTVVARKISVAVHADASQASLAMDSYGSGAIFTVLEATGDYDEYPVEENGQLWIRVRSDDGLVGWLPIDAVLPLP